MSFYKPAVKKQTLLLISGILWSIAGIVLNYIAFHWIGIFNIFEEIMLAIGGIIAALLISQFGFNKIAEKNINRINAYSDQICVFAFQEWKSYILMIFMVCLGIFLRSTGIIPKYVLTPMYIGLGMALFISSFKYYINYFYLAI